MAVLVFRSDRWSVGWPTTLTSTEIAQQLFEELIENLDIHRISVPGRLSLMTLVISCAMRLTFILLSELSKILDGF